MPIGQRTAEFDHNIKQSEARIDKICVGLITMQAEQKEAMNINNEQMGAISQQLQQSEDRIDHKASEQHTITETMAASGSYQVSPMLTAVSTNSTISVESMANPPPIMTTSSAPRALTDLQQQQADSTDRSRKGQRKPKERGNSSSSDSSLEREYTRWQENSGARDRRRSPQLPKMQIFNGRGSITWEEFIYQFERTAGRRQWENRKKVCRLLDCLADVALDVTVDWPINITLGLLINIIVKDHQINGRSPDQYTRGRSPEQYNRGRSPDRNTSKFNAYRPTTPPPRQRSYMYSPKGQRSPSPGYRANQSATPTTESLNSNGSGQ
ncbi:unnamed protein product [Mytilus coruscus]|uniref:Uncharacterized protein n=1 Tax=Mytilus coruscus TaxID=42192 RepID=A0A6J7ZVY1_MYTCO|nr:unnamed protein product [Mytilus coruscus]